MIAVLLLMIVLGIVLTQAVSQPGSVTLSWLRLGGLISVAMLTLAFAAVASSNDFATKPWILQQGPPPLWPWSGLLAVTASIVAQLMATQLGKRQLQRLLAAVALLLTSLVTAALAWQLEPTTARDGATLPAAGFASVLGTITLSGGLVGGFLMTMLLGHAYLTAGGEMTQQPFRRLVLLLAALLTLRTCLSLGAGLWPWLSTPSDRPQLWNQMMLIARYAVGLAVPAAFTYMTYDCVQRRSNQSATGILYVAGVLVILGEGVGLALWNATGQLF